MDQSGLPWTDRSCQGASCTCTCDASISFSPRDPAHVSVVSASYTGPYSDESIVDVSILGISRRQKFILHLDLLLPIQVVCHPERAIPPPRSDGECILQPILPREHVFCKMSCMLHLLPRIRIDPRIRSRVEGGAPSRIESVQNVYHKAAISNGALVYAC